MSYKNLEDKKSYNKKWDKENKDKRREYGKAWRKENMDKVREMKRQYYAKHKDKIKVKSSNAYHERYKFVRKENPDKYKELDRAHSQRVYGKRKALLLELRNEMGGKCKKCGYSKEIRILTFHHTDKNKVDNVTNLQSLGAIRAEAAKCILLCPNCHAIEHLQ